jgi:hypothetical protein
MPEPDVDRGSTIGVATGKWGPLRAAEAAGHEPVTGRRCQLASDENGKLLLCLSEGGMRRSPMQHRLLTPIALCCATLLFHRPPADPCGVLSQQVAETVLHGPVLLEDRGRCDWRLVSDPLTYIEFATTETGSLVDAPHARRQIVKDLGDSAVWYPVPGLFRLDVYTGHSRVQVWIYRKETGPLNPANDLNGCRIVAREIVKRLDVGR